MPQLKPWTLATASSSISGIYGSEIVLFNGSLWLYGGASLYGVDNLFIYNSVDGTTWNAVGTLPAGLGATGLNLGRVRVFGSIIVLMAGGTDVYYSHDGTTFFLAPIPGWAARTSFGATTFDGFLWVYGGRPTIGGAYTDLFKTSDPTIGWSPVAYTCAPGALYSEYNMAMYEFKGKMWLTGGNNTRTKVFSTPDGTTWTEETDSTVLDRNSHHPVEYYGDLVVVDGYNPAVLTLDALTSSDGLIYSLLIPPIWGNRWNTSVVVFQNKIWVFPSFGYTGGSLNVQDEIYYTEINTPVTGTLIAVPDSGLAPLSTNFTANILTGTVSSWSLDYGDSSYASGSGDPTGVYPHIYNSAKSFSASLYTIDISGNYANIPETVTVTLPPVPTATLSAVPTSGIAPLSVNFTVSAPSSYIASWTLSFNDGNYISGAGDPSGTYNNIYTGGGTFSATLILIDIFGQSNIIYQNINVTTPALSADLIVNPAFGDSPLVSNISVTVITGILTGWEIDFGDGTPKEIGSGNFIGSRQHTYQTNGEYTVTFIGVDAFSNSAILTEYVYVQRYRRDPLIHFENCSGINVEITKMILIDGDPVILAGNAKGKCSLKLFNNLIAKENYQGMDIIKVFGRDIKCIALGNVADGTGSTRQRPSSSQSSMAPSSSTGYFWDVEIPFGAPSP